MHSNSRLSKTNGTLTPREYMWLDTTSTEAHFDSDDVEVSEVVSLQKDKGGELLTADGRSGELLPTDQGSEVGVRGESDYEDYEDSLRPLNFLDVPASKFLEEDVIVTEDVVVTEDVEGTEHVEETEHVEGAKEVEGQDKLVEETASARHSEDEELEIGYRKRKPEPLPDDSDDELVTEVEESEGSEDEEKSNDQEAAATVKDELGRIHIATGRSGKGKVFLASSQLRPSTIEEHVNDV